MTENNCVQDNKGNMMAIQDAMYVLNGKWKIAIISSICYHNKRRFSDILNDVVGISNKMLSKELKELELNGVITRKVYDATPVLVEYELTESAKRLSEVLDKMVDWGMQHRTSLFS